MANLLSDGVQRVLVTGGAGFIGGAVVRRLLRDSDVTVFNLDKCGYASDLSGIEGLLAERPAESAKGESRHQLLKLDLVDEAATAEALTKIGRAHV